MANKKSITHNIIHDISRPKGYQLTEKDSVAIQIEDVDEYIANLEPVQYRLLHQYYTEQQPLANIAKSFSCSEQTTKHRLQRLLHLLRHKFNFVYRDAMQTAASKSLYK